MYKTLAVVGVVLILFSVLLHFSIPAKASLQDCITLLSHYDENVTALKFQNFSIENLRFLVGKGEKERLVAGYRGDKFEECSLIYDGGLNKVKRKFICDRKSYFYEKKEVGGFYLVYLQKENEFTRLNVISKENKAKFQLLTSNIENELNRCIKA